MSRRLPWSRVAGQGVRELLPHFSDTPRAPGRIRAARGPYQRVDRRIADACGRRPIKRPLHHKIPLTRPSYLSAGLDLFTRRTSPRRRRRPSVRHRGGGRERCPHVQVGRPMSDVSFLHAR